MQKTLSVQLGRQALRSFGSSKQTPSAQTCSLACLQVWLHVLRQPHQRCKHLPLAQPTLDGRVARLGHHCMGDSTGGESY